MILTVMAGGAVVASPASANPTFPPQVYLTADTPNQLTGHTAALTAISQIDVGPTPYWIEIYNTDTGARVQTCGSGTTCIVGVTEPVPTQHHYRAYIAGYGSTLPPPNIQSSSDVTVTWQQQLALNGPPNDAYRGQPATLIAASRTDVGPTPYYIQIYDTTTGARVQTCGSGNACQVNVTNYSSGAHNYIAYISLLGATNPPPTVQATSNPITVNWYFIA